MNCRSIQMVLFDVDGVLTDKNEIEGLDIKPKVVKENVQGGIENHVQLRTFKASSIIGLRIDGVEVKSK